MQRWQPVADDNRTSPDKKSNQTKEIWTGRTGKNNCNFSLAMVFN
jgi:hypothetical protein